MDGVAWAFWNSRGHFRAIVSMLIGRADGMTLDGFSSKSCRTFEI